MSTRSGKRIHGSVHENSMENVIALQEKKRKNYVKYPSDEEQIVPSSTEIILRSTRKSQRNMLKEKNILEAQSEILDFDNKKARLTRKATKIQAIESIENVKPNDQHKADKINKKNRKKKALSNANKLCDSLHITSKKKADKKKNKEKSSFTVDDNTLNMSVESFYSAAGSLDKNEEIKEETKHILTDFSNNMYSGLEVTQRNNSKTIKKTKSLSGTAYNEAFSNVLLSNSVNTIQSCVSDINYQSINKECISVNNSPQTNNTLLEIRKKGNGKRSINAPSPVLELELVERVDLCASQLQNSNTKKKKISYNDINELREFSASSTNESEQFQNSVHVVNKNQECKKKIKEGSSNNNIHLDTTFEMQTSNRSSEQVDVHTNSQKSESKRSSQSRNQVTVQRGSLTNLNRTYDKNLPTDNIFNTHSSTYYERLDRTFDLKNNSKLDSTFDKSQNKVTSGSSFILSLDTTDNLMSETSMESSRNNITSDDSRTVNIVNSTPVSIESSMNETLINISSNVIYSPLKKNTVNISKNSTLPLNVITPLKIEGPIVLNDISSTKIRSKTTALKREGTYTEIKVTKPSLHNYNTSTEVKTPPTLLKREGTYTEIKNNKTPLKSEGTYINIISKSSSKNNEDKTNQPITTSEHNGTFVKVKPVKLNREGTFTKDHLPNNITPKESPNKKMSLNVTPTRRKSLPSPGQTPFSLSKSTTKDKTLLHITKSIEKSTRLSSSADAMPKASKVMFCSPVNHPAVVTHMKGKVIKSNLKGSNKSFIFDDSDRAAAHMSRKRSYTQSQTEEGSTRKQTHGPNQTVRQSRLRSTSAFATLQHPHAAAKLATPSKLKYVSGQSPKMDTKMARTKLPNFAALHHKQFAKMESLDECQQRKAKRARHLLTPTASVAVLERASPKESQQIISTTQSNKTETPKKHLMPTNSKAYTRFGFKLNTDVNPFSIPAQSTDAKADGLAVRPSKRRVALPSPKGATSARKHLAKRNVLRGKFVTEKLDDARKENRTIIKGVRTNRRFELQMKLRNVNV